MNIDQDEYARLLELANMWKMRAIVGARLAEYFSSIFYANGEHFIDVKKEIEMQADRLLKQRVFKIDASKEEMEVP